jgi:hypothetical protein
VSKDCEPGELTSPNTLIQLFDGTFACVNIYDPYTNIGKVYDR